MNCQYCGGHTIEKAVGANVWRICAWLRCPGEAEIIGSVDALDTSSSFATPA
jgi:hypothetical protein